MRHVQCVLIACLRDRPARRWIDCIGNVLTSSVTPTCYDSSMSSDIHYVVRLAPFVLITVPCHRQQSVGEPESGA